ncbi:MAG: hypothetical protein R2824_07695 [Saprospiraceae bacterium]|nr:hypothetical protein [Lewinella sp.]
MKATIYAMMSTPKLLFLALFAAATLFASCEKESDTPAAEAMTDDEAVAMIEGAMALEAEGMTSEIDAAIELTEIMMVKSPTNVNCGVEQDSSINRTFDSARFSGSLSSTWSWLLNCTAQDVPTDLSFNREASVSYESLRLISDDSSTGGWSMSNLTTGTEFVFNGNYSRTGSQESKVRNQTSFTSQIDFVLTDLKVGKLKRRINSGTATFSLTGESSTGQSYSITGSIVFLGDGEAEVTINGTTYPIDLY